MNLVNKGCSNCKVGFRIPEGQEFIWNWCPTCGTGLELDPEDVEIEYDTEQKDT
jgi:hypothetical protein